MVEQLEVRRRGSVAAGGSVALHVPAEGASRLRGHRPRQYYTRRLTRAPAWSSSRGLANLVVPLMAVASVHLSFVPDHLGTGTPMSYIADRARGRPSPSPMAEREDTSWFYSPAWQEGEARVDGHIRAGRVRRFQSVEDFLAHLRRQVADREQGGS